jgi:glycogen synthase
LAIEVSYAADWGVMPSWYEPGGITQLNWKGAGTPTIVHDVDGLHDTMHDGVDGFTVPSQPGKNQRIDQEKFYQTIREAAELSLTEPEEALNMQFSAYQDRVNYFWSRVAKETLKQYERILARRQYDAVFRPELDVYKYNGTQPVQSQFCRAVVDQNWFPKIPN